MTKIAMLVFVAVLSVVCPCLSFVSPPARLLQTPGCSASGTTSRPGVTRATLRTPLGDTEARASAARTSINTLRAAAGEGEGEVEAARAAAAAAAAASVAVEEVVPEKSNLPFYLDPSTRGGAVVVPTLSLLLPLGAYGGLTAVGVDGSKAGAWVGVGYTMFGLIAWVGSYFFRVATKNMTYAVQLKNYEQAVIEKRFSELEEDEVDALLDEVNEP